AIGDYDYSNNGTSVSVDDDSSIIDLNASIVNLNPTATQTFNASSTSHSILEISRNSIKKNGTGLSSEPRGTYLFPDLGDSATENTLATQEWAEDNFDENT